MPAALLLYMARRRQSKGVPTLHRLPVEDLSGPAQAAIIKHLTPTDRKQLSRVSRDCARMVAQHSNVTVRLACKQQVQQQPQQQPQEQQSQAGKSTSSTCNGQPNTQDTDMLVSRWHSLSWLLSACRSLHVTMCFGISAAFTVLRPVTTRLTLFRVHLTKAVIQDLQLCNCTALIALGLHTCTTDAVTPELVLDYIAHGVSASVTRLQLCNLGRACTILALSLLRRQLCELSVGHAALPTYAHLKHGYGFTAISQLALPGDLSDFMLQAMLPLPQLKHVTAMRLTACKDYRQCTLSLQQLTLKGGAELDKLCLLPLQSIQLLRIHCYIAGGCCAVSSLPAMVQYLTTCPKLEFITEPAEYMKAAPPVFELKCFQHDQAIIDLLALCTTNVYGSHSISLGLRHVTLTPTVFGALTRLPPFITTLRLHLCHVLQRDDIDSDPNNFQLAEARQQLWAQLPSSLPPSITDVVLHTRVAADILALEGAVSALTTFRLVIYSCPISAAKRHEQLCQLKARSQGRVLLLAPWE